MRETSFKAVFSDAKAVRDLFKALTSVAREADITIGREGLAIKSYDGGESAMFSLTTPKAQTEEYECLRREAFQVRVNLEHFLNHFPKDIRKTKLTLAWTGKTQTLEIAFRGHLTKRASISTLEPSGQKVSAPELCFNTRVTMVTSDLNAAIQDTAPHAHVTTFEADQKTFRLGYLSDKLADLTVVQEGSFEFDKQHGSIIELAVREPSKASYNNRVLEPIIKTLVPISQATRVEFSTDTPCRITPELKSMRETRLEFYVAHSVTEAKQVKPEIRCSRCGGPFDAGPQVGDTSLTAEPPLCQECWITLTEQEEPNNVKPDQSSNCKRKRRAEVNGAL